MKISIHLLILGLMIFKKHIEIIENQNIEFVNPKNFETDLSQNKNKRKILLTIDDGYSSFYENAWPILKKKNTFYFIYKHSRGRCSWLYELGRNSTN